MKRSDIKTIDVLYAAKQASRYKGTWEVLKELTGAPEKVVYAAIRREINRNFLDCGVSERTAFITDKGEEYFNEHNTK